MIPVPYQYVRWVILVVGAAIVSAYFLFPLGAGALVGLSFLLVLTAAALVVPPGIYSWLVRGICPTCGRTVEWAAVNPPGEPYNEQVVVRCPACDKPRVEWEYRS